MDDLGSSALIGKSTYNQLNTLIPIGIAERGATLRAQLAQEASGMTYDGLDAVDLELQRGAWAMSKLFQKGFYQGEKATGGKTGTDEYGTYYQYGFDGCRAILGNPSNYAAAYFPGSVNNAPIVTEVAGSIYDAVNNAVAQLISIGADPGSIHMSATQARKLAKEGSYIARQDNSSANGMSYGAYVTSLVTVNGELPVYVIPGDSIGSYTPPAASAFNGLGNVEDIYVFDNGSVEWRYLGPSMPFVIEIPMGINPAGGTDLAKRFLIAWLAAPVFNAPVFNAKVRNLVAG